MKILLIAGHGAGDPGAIGNGYHEADLTRELLKLIKPKLSKFAEVSVFDMNKNPYEYLKRNKYNFKKYDYVFEIHFNAAAYDRTGDGKTTGTEILVHPNEKAVTVEENILKRMEVLGFSNREVQYRTNLQNMNIVKGGQNVSYALLETCFIDDKDDMALYAKRKEAVAYAVAEGIAEGFGLIRPIEQEETKGNIIDEVDEMTKAELKEFILETLKEVEAEKAKEAVGTWAADSFGKAKENGILDGTAPKSSLTREQAAAVLDRLGLLK